MYIGEGFESDRFEAHDFHEPALVLNGPDMRSGKEI